MNKNKLNTLRLPVIVAPMFLVSGPDLVVASSKAGLVGSFPGPNARTIEDLENWMHTITNSLDGELWAFNMIAHRTYDRFQDELDLIARFKPPIVITALGSPARVLETVHSYGGIVIADVNTVEYAKKCVEYGADGLALVSYGAGGHTGTLSPFVFTSHVREFFDGIIVLAGSISNGRHIRAAQCLGADLCYMGTRFIASNESMAVDEYKNMVARSLSTDLRLTNLFTGANAYYLKDSIIKNGLDPDNLETNEKGFNISGSQDKISAWKDIWSAGQGVGFSEKIESLEEITLALENEWKKVKL
jgi:nitronate monooxygenase